jgi:hypothetical protein
MAKQPEYVEGPEALENFKKLADGDSTGSAPKTKEALHMAWNSIFLPCHSRAVKT